MASENKIGIYICQREKGAEEGLDLKELKKIIQTFPAVGVVGDLFCDQWESGLNLMVQEVQEKNLSHLILASFHALNPLNGFQKKLSQVGITPEKCSLITIFPEYLGTKVEPEIRQERAALLLKQAISHQQVSESFPLEPLETIPRILILGGDLSALQAAQEAINLGYQVLMLEPGKAFGQGGVHSGSNPERDLSLWKELEGHPGVRLETQSRLLELSGMAGRFEILYQNGEDQKVRESVGAVVVALPVQEQPNFGRYGLEPSRRVLSLSQLEQLLSSPAYRDKLFPKNQPTEVAFLLGLAGESYPGVVLRALNNARSLQQEVDTQVYLLSGNMKVAAQGLERIYTQAREEGILFFRFHQEKLTIMQTGEGLSLEFLDEILGSPLVLQPDLVIVDETLQAHPQLEPLALSLNIPRDAAGFMTPDQVYTLPVRTPRKGIYVVGGSRRPLSADEDTLSEIQEAILSAAELIGTGIREVEAPRVEIDRKKCTICLTCVRSCPHQALTFLFRRPQVSTLACQVCGICASECPMDAIQIKNYRDRAVTGEVSSFFFERKYDTMAPQVVVFCCKNSADRTLQQALLYREALPVGFEFVQIPCAGKLDPDYVLHALREGADGILVLACHPDGCKSFEGNLKALERVNFLREMMPELGLEEDRIQFQSIAPGMVSQFLQIIYGMELKFRKMGISPVRRGLGIQRIYDKFTFPADSKTFLV